jgi:PEP-CTERM motif
MTNVLGNGTSNGSELGFYAVNVIDADSLQFAINAIPSASQVTEIWLFDGVGNLVAEASGNAADGLGSIIDFFVSAGNAGTWDVEVINPGTTPYLYDLSVQGATGLGPVDPTPSPEPSSLLLLAVGLAGVGKLRAGWKTAIKSAQPI